MKKIMFLTFVCGILATSAFAHDGQTQPATKASHIFKVAEAKKLFTDIYLWSSSSITADAYIRAHNTSTGLDYYLTAPAMDSDHMLVPEGTYDIYLSTSSTYANWYVADDDDSASGNGYNYTFYGVTLTTYASTVISISYP